MWDFFLFHLGLCLPRARCFNKTKHLLLDVLAHLSPRTSKKVVRRLSERMKKRRRALVNKRALVFLVMHNYKHQWFSKMARSVTKDSQTLKVSLMIQESQFENGETSCDLNRRRECAIKILLAVCHRSTRVQDCFPFRNEPTDHKF